MRNHYAQWSWVLYEGTAALFLVSLCVTEWLEYLLVTAAVMAVLAPVIGSVSDGKGRKKKWFRIIAIAGSIAAAFFPRFSILALCGFAGTMLLHDAFLTDVCDTGQVDEISAAGCSWFLLCSVLSLVILQMLIKSGSGAKMQMVLSAVWAVLLSLPALLVVRHKHEALPADRRLLAEVLQTISQTAATMAKNRKILMLVIACFFLTIGTAAVGASYLIHKPMADLFTGKTRDFLLAAIPVAMLCGIMGQKFGSVRVLIIMSVLCVIGYLMDLILPGTMFLAAGITCGGMRTVCRAAFVKIIPRDRAAAYFGFYHCLGYLAVLLGIGASFLPLTNLVTCILFLIGGLILGLQRRRFREFKE